MRRSIAPFSGSDLSIHTQSLADFITITSGFRVFGTHTASGPPSIRTKQRLTPLVGAMKRAGFTPGDEVLISLDIASSEFYRDGAYRLALEGRVLDSDAMSAMLIDWLDRYPIVSIG